MKKAFIYFSILFIITSCVSRKKIVYLQGNQNSENSSNNYEPLIQKDDILYINISTDEPSASSPFNLDSSTGGSSSGQNQSYLVDTFGNIDFPIIGKVSVAGYSLNDAKSILKEKLSTYLKNPVINLRIMNFKVTVLGEVAKPGEVRVQSQRITLLDALAESGDITIYGRRNNLLLIRDFQGTKSFNRIDLTKADFVNSPFYYLDQNDIIYVEPMKSKIDSTAFGSNLSSILSILGFGLTVLILTKKI